MLPIAVAIVAAAGLSCPSAASAAETAEAQQGIWMPKQATFTYMGFTTKYSCEGLVDQVKSALLALGARKDLTVYGTGCAVATGRPAPLPGVKIRMHVLEPVPAAGSAPGEAAGSGSVSGGKAASEASGTSEAPTDEGAHGKAAAHGSMSAAKDAKAGSPVPAHWKAVNLKLGRDVASNSGQCELLEQIRQHLLPLFTARDIVFKSHCVPHQVSPGSTVLRAEVLMADAKPGSRG